MRIHSCSKYLNKNTKNSLTIWYTRDWCMSGMLKPWSWPISVKEVFSGLKEASYLMELIAQLVINISTPRLRWQADYTRSPIAWLQVFLIQKHLGRQRDGDVTNLQGDMRSKVQSGSEAKSWGSVEAFWSAVNLHRGRVTAFWAPRDAPGVIRSQVTSKF